VRLENYTVPFASRELVDGRSVDESSLIWGTVDGWLGLGWRWPVAPFNADNELLVGVYYHGGLEYHRRTSDTPDGAVIPRDTYTHGLRVRLRGDGLQRNLLEQPHQGWAAGLDLEYTRRDFWRDYSTPGLGTWDREETRDVVKASGYLVAALPVPWLNERHRLVFQGHAGFAPVGKLDRFSAFRVGGGPLPTEASDLGRNPFPGAMFDQFPLEEYLILTVEYRVELLFFVFLHLRATYAIGSTSTIRGGLPRFRQDTGYTVTAALTTGFPWDSTLYFEFDYDANGAVRGGDELGSTFVVMWSKAF